MVPFVEPCAFTRCEFESRLRAAFPLKDIFDVSSWPKADIPAAVCEAWFLRRSSDLAHAGHWLLQQGHEKKLEL